MFEVLYIIAEKNSQFMSGKDIHYTFCGNTSSALSLIHDNKYDVIIIDNTSTLFSGFLLVKQITCGKNTSLWMIVNSLDSVTLIGANRLGIDKIIPKVSQEMIFELVNINYDNMLTKGILKSEADYIIRVDKLLLNTKDMTAKCVNGVWVKLQQKQYEILKYLMERSGECVTSDELWKVCWKENLNESFRSSCLNTLHNHIFRLRSVLSKTSSSVDASKYIHTVTNKGYKFLVKND